MRSFLFTDIESSTRLWEQQTEQMAEALKQHDSLVASAISSNHGEVIKTTGDGFLAVFELPAHAVESSVAIQRELGAADWGVSEPIRARIGIHSGHAESREGDYFGPTLNRTARIMASGHGGHQW